MVKRLMMVVLLSVSVIALRGSVVQAHYSGYTFIPTFQHIASYNCRGNFVGVPNPEIHPGFFECRVEVNVAQVLCSNPNGKIVTPGTPSEPFTLFGGDAFRTEDITDKQKGKALKNIYFADEDSPLFSQHLCHQRNWNVIDELILDANIVLSTYECGQSSCAPEDRVKAWEGVLHCTIPDQYDILNPPPGNGVPTDYECELMSETHFK